MKCVMAKYRETLPVVILRRSGRYFDVRDRYESVIRKVYIKDLSDLHVVPEIPEIFLTKQEKWLRDEKVGKLPTGVIRALCARKSCRRVFVKKSPVHRFCCRKCQYTTRPNT